MDELRHWALGEQAMMAATGGVNNTVASALALVCCARQQAFCMWPGAMTL
jgi:hypothetical protein